MQPVYILIGCPGSGKSWVSGQLTHQYTVVPHDDFIGSKSSAFFSELMKQAHFSEKPVLTETPFSVSQIKDPLEAKGVQVIPIFIQESHDVLIERYEARNKTIIPAGHLTRQKTYAERAALWRSFSGTSQQCLEYLKQKAECLL